ncbi:MAG: hypothetical protein NZP74_03180 [Anaerolineales bacterium]|nr:hypothetical protein [Anaerolineales bacterium]MDW8279541.1 hypothetical protein [Anaerolineales bacterium]
MSKASALRWLVPLIALLALISAGAGLLVSGGDGPLTFTNVYGQTVELYGRGLYRHDSLLAGAGFRGTDAVTLFLAIPLLLAAYWRARRGSQDAQLVLLAALFYFLYNGASMTFSAMFNPLFLVYAALFSASLFAVILALATFDTQTLAARVRPGFPHRGVAVFTIVVGFGTLLIWLSEVIPPLLTGAAPSLIGPYTTLFTHGFDSAVITPAAVLTGILVWQRRPPGYLLAAPIMLFCALVGVVVIGQSISQALSGLVFPIPVYIGMVGSWVVMGGFALGLTRSFFRNLEPQ